MKTEAGGAADSRRTDIEKNPGNQWTAHGETIEIVTAGPDDSQSIESDAAEPAIGSNILNRAGELGETGAEPGRGEAETGAEPGRGEAETGLELGETGELSEAAAARLAYLLRPLEPSKKQEEYIAMGSQSFTRDVFSHFCANRWAMTGLFLLTVIVLFAVLGGWLSPYAFDAQDAAVRNQLPSLSHWFGTDKFGRDIFTRVMSGARISLFIGVVSTAVCAVAGSVYGGISGYLGGIADLLLMRVCDILYAIPPLLYVILIMLIFGSSVESILIGICVSGWVGVARIVRAQVIALKEREYVLASYVLGASRRRIFFRHMITNSMGPILVTLTLMIPQTIFMEAFLSFIGIGISAPQASLGTLAQDAKAYLLVYPSQIMFPIAVICLIIFSLTFISKGLEEALDPKARR